MVDVQGLATIDFLVNSYGLIIYLFSLLEMMSISGSVKGTEVTVSFSWHFLQHFFIIWGHLLPSGAMMDSRYCSFLPIPPSQCPDLSTAVSCDLASQCAVQVLMTSATSGVLSGRERGERHRYDLSKCLYHPGAGWRYNNNFLVEPFPGMNSIHWFIAIHVTQSKHSEKKMLCRLISSGNVFQQPCQL